MFGNKRGRFRFCLRPTNKTLDTNTHIWMTELCLINLFLSNSHLFGVAIQSLTRQPMAVGLALRSGEMFLTEAKFNIRLKYYQHFLPGINNQQFFVCLFGFAYQH